MKKVKNKGKARAVLIMLACMALSVPLGMHTTLARADDAALEAFYNAGTYDTLVADVQLTENILRNSKVLLSDLAEYKDIASLQLAQQEMEEAYRRYESSLSKKAAGRSGAQDLVQAYNTFSGAVLRWLDAADTAIANVNGEFSTYETFRDKFRANHNAVLYGSYNAEAGAYNLYFEEPAVRVLQGISFTKPLLLFREPSVE